jgi:hypothetical protein
MTELKAKYDGRTGRGKEVGHDKYYMPRPYSK